MNNYGGPWVHRGIPMYKKNQDCHCLVTIEEGDDVKIRHWVGTSSRAIRKKCRERYPKAVLGYGHVWWVTR